MVVDTYDTNTGGIVSTKRFTEGLRKAGHKVIVLSTGKKEKDKVVLKEFYPPLAKNIMKKMKMVFAKPEEEKLKEVFSKVDLVHVQLPFSLGIKAITLARKMKLPVVSSFHVQAENITKNIGISTQKANDWIYSFFLKNIYNRSDIVICPSKFAQEELQLHKLKSTSAIISNGITKDFKPLRIKKRFLNRFVILTVGRLAAEKNQEQIIDSILKSKHKKNIQLVIVGDGPLKSKLKKEGKKLPHNPLFLHNLSTEKLVKWYNNADLYIHCGQVELEGMTVLEAMACATIPLIVDAKKSASSQFALTKNYLFQNATELARKIDYWFEHPLELLKNKDRCFQKAQKYLFSTSVKKLENAYLQAIRINKQNQLGKQKTEKAKRKLIQLRFLKKRTAK